MTSHKGLRRACVAAGATLALIVGAGCSEPYKGTGTIVEREYDDPDSGVTPGYWADGGEDCGYEYEYVSGYEYDYVSGDYEYTSGYENVWVCEDRPDVYIPPMPWYDGEHWHLVIEDAEGKRHDVRNVDESVYNECQEGRTYNTETKDCRLR